MDKASRNAWIQKNMVYFLEEAGYRILPDSTIIGKRSLKPMVPTITKGYHTITVHVFKTQITLRVHKIIAYKFCPNPEGKPEVNHKDGNKLNNCAENLEWVTSSENQKHAFKIGLQVINTIAANEKCSVPVLDTQTGVFYNTVREATEYSGVSRQTMVRILMGRNRSTRYVYA